VNSKSYFFSLLRGQKNTAPVLLKPAKNEDQASSTESRASSSASLMAAPDLLTSPSPSRSSS